MDFIEKRLKFYGLDAIAQNDLKAAYELISPHLPGIVDTFYRHVLSTPETAAVLAGHSVSRLKEAQARHWSTLFTGGFGRDYVERARAIGRAHVRIGLDQQWHFGGYAILLDAFMHALERSNLSKADLVKYASCVSRAIMLDIDIAVTIHADEYDAKRRSDLNHLADLLEERVGTVVGNLNAVSERINGSSSQVSSELSQIEDRASAVAAAAEEASISVVQSAGAAEELASSVREISRQVQSSRETTRDAVDQSAKAFAIMAELSEAARQVDVIVSMISAVASQTNLLALNATIEAARAGEAGRGFAVVAAEVKSLANQTSRATGEIASKVAGIQNAAKRAVDSIHTVGASIKDIDAASVAISAAIEEQSVTASQIGASSGEAARGAKDVSRNIAGVADGVRVTAGATDGLQSISMELSDEGRTLKDVVQTLLSDLRLSAGHARAA
jgi:methyl-accepting chemotaxis protein